MKHACGLAGQSGAPSTRGGWRPAPTCVLFLGLLLLLPALAPAQAPQEPAVTAIRVGFNGRYRVGFWTPVEVTLRGGKEQLSGELELILPDGDGVPYRVPSPRILLLPFGNQTSLLYVKFGSQESSLRVAFRADNRDSFSRTFDTSAVGEDALPVPMETSQELIVAVGPSLGIEDLVRQQDPDSPEAAQVAQIEDAAALPRRWYGYDGVDAVVLSGSKLETYAQLAPGSAQISALDEWVRRGGRLIISAGSKAAGLFAANLDPASADARQRSEPLARFVPGRFAGLTQLRDTSAWEIYSGSQEPVPEASAPLVVPRLTEVAGRIEAAAGNVPLVVRAPHGLGEVVFFAGDFDQAPFVQWKGRATFLNRVLARSPSESSDTEIGAVSGQFYGSGYTDLAGPLLAAMDQFEGVRPVHFSFVAVLICIYILLIGPGDYFFLKLVLRKMEYTWITFPLIVLAVSGGAYVLANWLKGDQLRLNQVDVVDVDTTTGLARGTSWFNIFSPRMDYYHVSAQPQLPDGQRPPGGEVLMSWLNAPGSGMRGINLGESSRLQRSTAYTFKPDLTAISNVPIQVWSTKSFLVHWKHTAAPKLESVYLNADLQSTTRHDLNGSVTNSLDIPLSDCLLVYGLERDEGAEAWSYSLGSVEPGQTVLLGSSQARAPVKLRKILTQPEFVDEGKGRYHEEIRPYNPEANDPASHLRLMLFYDVVGGRGYTHLLNRSQRRLDLSRQIRAGRAILFGKADRAGTVLQRDGEPLAGAADRHWTYYRFLVPVKPASGS